MTPRNPNTLTPTEQRRAGMATEVTNLVGRINNPTIAEVEKARLRDGLNGQFRDWLKLETGTTYPDKDGKALLPIVLTNGTPASFSVGSVDRLKVGLEADNYRNGAEKLAWNRFLAGFSEAVFQGIDRSPADKSKMEDLISRRPADMEKQVEALAGGATCVVGIADLLVENLAERRPRAPTEVEPTPSNTSRGTGLDNSRQQAVPVPEAGFVDTQTAGANNGSEPFLGVAYIRRTPEKRNSVVKGEPRMW